MQLIEVGMGSSCLDYIVQSSLMQPYVRKANSTDVTRNSSHNDERIGKPWSKERKGREGGKLYDMRRIRAVSGSLFRSLCVWCVVELQWERAN